MRELQRVLDMQTDSKDQHFQALLRAKVAAGLGSINAQVKVDENQMRAAVIDQLPKLLEILAEEQLKLAQRRAERATSQAS